MTKHPKKAATSEETKAEALTIARGIQKPGQTKEQTKLVAQGIQKGIELYKKQHKAKARELDKKAKKLAAQSHSSYVPTTEDQKPIRQKSSLLPWILLAVSWCAFGLYFAFST